MNATHLPQGDRIIVQRLEDESVSKLVVTGLKTEKPMRAKVIAVGPGRLTDRFHVSASGCIHPYRVPMTVRPGDIVLIGKYVGTAYEETDPVTFKTTEYAILREEDVLTIIKKGTK